MSNNHSGSMPGPQALPGKEPNITPGVTQLDFNQAMIDFKIMFPETPEDIIEAVLRSNKGVVDATIDELLKISTQQSNTASLEQTIRESSKTRLITRPAIYKPYNSNNFYNSHAHESSSSMASYSKNFQHFNDNISKDSLRYRNNWNPPLLGDLPVSFLCISLNDTQRKLTNINHSMSGAANSQALGNEASLINTTMLQQKMEENERNRQIVSSDDPELTQFLADERFAILLQNEEFVRELRLNQDFMSTLDGGISSRPGTAEGSSHGTQASAHDSDAAFKERLRNMSKVSKRKFAQLARLFSGKSKKNFQHRQLDDNANGTDYQYCEDFSNENYEDFRSRGRIN